MKIDAVVVLYNPAPDVLSHIQGYVHLVNKLFVMDNSTEKNVNLIDEISKMKNAVYIDLDGNQGIALALKQGMELAIADNADYCLTMDQDSVFPTDQYNDILKYIEENQDYGIIGLNADPRPCEGTGLVLFNFWVTSGNFIKISDYKQLRGFNPDLFIDCVDFDLYEQFASKGIKTAYIKEIKLDHAIGDMKKHKFLWKTITTDDHALVRYYYRFRNIVYLHKYVNKKFYRKQLFLEMSKERIKILLFEENKRAKFKIIRRGIKDGKKGILGPYKEGN